MEISTNKLDISTQTNPVRQGNEYEEPQGELEQALARLWQDLFRIDRIGRNDNFFELGGNSLLGMDISEMLTTHLISTRSHDFQHPTIRGARTSHRVSVSSSRNLDCQRGLAARKRHVHVRSAPDYRTICFMPIEDTRRIRR